LYLVGPDADRVLAAVRPALEATAFLRDATVELR
jgi:hypothetical protein